MRSVRYFVLFISFLFILSNSFSCLNYSDFYDLGGGFKYGYFDTKGLLNVYYNDQGVVDHGICYSVAWNKYFILVHYYTDNSKPDMHNDKECLIEKRKYSLHPVQMDSDGIVTNKDSINTILRTNILTNKKVIEYP